MFDPNANMPRINRGMVVHGHDHSNKDAVARFLNKLGLQPVILQEQSDEGQIAPTLPPII